jgi:hypothetical protein
VPGCSAVEAPVDHLPRDSPAGLSVVFLSHTHTDTDTKTHTQTHTLIHSYTQDRQIDRQTDRQPDRQTDRQTDRQPCFMLHAAPSRYCSTIVTLQLMHAPQRKLNRRVICFAIVTRLSRFSSQQKVTSQPPSLASPIGHHPPFPTYMYVCTRTESRTAPIVSDRPLSTNDTGPAPLVSSTYLTQ